MFLAGTLLAVINLTIIDISVSCVWPVIDQKFRRNIVKVHVALNPRGDSWVDPQTTYFDNILCKCMYVKIWAELISSQEYTCKLWEVGGLDLSVSPSSQLSELYRRPFNWFAYFTYR